MLRTRQWVSCARRKALNKVRYIKSIGGFSARWVSLSLTLQHDRVIYLLKDSPANRKLIHRYIDLYEYPDGRIELRAGGVTGLRAL